MTPEQAKVLLDPILFGRVLWPDTIFYDKQIEIIYSVEENAETYVPAGNQLGKDFVSGFICVSRFMRSMMLGRTCRIVTTSVAEHHLKVLWGEIGRFLATARDPLNPKQRESEEALGLLDKVGGPLVLNYQELRRVGERYSKNPYSYCVGRVSAKGEGLAGHHAEDTLFIADEASGVDDESYRMAQGWAKSMLIIGNCNPSVGFFYKGIKAGDLIAS